MLIKSNRYRGNALLCNVREKSSRIDDISGTKSARTVLVSQFWPESSISFSGSLVFSGKTGNEILR